MEGRALWNMFGERETGGGGDPGEELEGLHSAERQTDRQGVKETETDRQRTDDTERERERVDDTERERENGRCQEREREWEMPREGERIGNMNGAALTMQKGQGKGGRGRFSS